MTSTRHPEHPENPSQGSCDLRYLLTAYLFDSLSEEGRREVEAQLEQSAACRAELEELRATLELVEEALGMSNDASSEDENGKLYSFEERRLERVLEASRRESLRRGIVFGLPARVFWSTAAAAVLLLGVFTWQLSGVRRAAELGKSESKADLVTSAKFAEDEEEFSESESLWGVPSTPEQFKVAQNAEPTTPAGATPPPNPEAAEANLGIGGGAAGAYGYRAGQKSELRKRAEGRQGGRGVTGAGGSGGGASADGEGKGGEADSKKNLPAIVPELVVPGKPPPPTSTPAENAVPLRDPASAATSESKPRPARSSRPERQLETPKADDSLGDANANSWARLNEKQLRNGVQIGGVARKQQSKTRSFERSEVDKELERPTETTSAEPGRDSTSRWFAGRQGEPDAGGAVARGGQDGASGVSKAPASPAQQGQSRRGKYLGERETRGEARAVDENGNSAAASLADARATEQVTDYDDDGRRDRTALPGDFGNVTVDVPKGANLDNRSNVDSQELGLRVDRVDRADGRIIESAEKRSADHELALRMEQKGKDVEFFYKKVEETLEELQDIEEAKRSGEVNDSIRVVSGLVPAEGQGGDPARAGELSPNDADFGIVGMNERDLRTWSYFNRVDRELSFQQIQARRLSIPPPVVGDEGLGEKEFRRRYRVNPFVSTRRDRQSTFGMDVDNAAYARTREMLRSGQLPPPGTVRVEEFVNNFPEERPADPDAVFTVRCEGGPAPFGGRDLELLKITLKSRELRTNERKDAILTFAIDTSGSMALDGKLDLVRSSLKQLVDSLLPTDRVALVAFSTHAYVALPHTAARQRDTINRAIDSLHATGGTNVEAGIELAYRLANEARNRRAANRVLLCSDGVANLGAGGPETLLARIRSYARENLVSLYTYGFGTGGSEALKGDAMLQRLANEGDGNYRFVDSQSAANDLFTLPEKLQVLAADAKIQVEFDPEVVTHYRLLGYEKRDIADADFRNDDKDAGEVGPGSTVTVLYEIKRQSRASSLGRIFLRYRDTTTRRVEELDYDLPTGVIAARLSDTSDRFRFLASVAEFSELLRGSYFARNGSYGDVLRELDRLSPVTKRTSPVAEVRELVTRAQALSAKQDLQVLTDVLSESR